MAIVRDGPARLPRASKFSMDRTFELFLFVKVIASYLFYFI